MKKLLALLMVCWLANGCLPTVAGVAAYKMSQNRTQNQYREYVSEMEMKNQERKDKGLEPMPVKSFMEWKHNL